MKAIFNKAYAQRIEDIDSTCAASINLHQFYLNLAPREVGSANDMKAGRDQFEHWGDNSTEPQDVEYQEEEIGGVRCMWAKPHDADQNKILICFHGGAYLFGSMYSHRKSYAHIAKASGCYAIIVDYHLLPEYTADVPLTEAASVYEELLDRGYSNTNIGLIGDSAGGAMSLALPLVIKEKNLPMAACIMAISPWIDCKATTDIYNWNKRDFLNPREAVIGQGRVLETYGAKLDDPHIAPIHLTKEQVMNYPPVYIQVGGIENFVDEAEIVSETIYQAGGEIRLDILENMQHSFTQLAGRCINADQAIHRFAVWCKEHM